jgi:hypothetical protein
VPGRGAKPPPGRRSGADKHRRRVAKLALPAAQDARLAADGLASPASG